MSERGDKPALPPGTVEAKVEAAWRAARPLLAVLMIFGVVAALGGPYIVYLLISRGLRERHPSWFALGVAVGLPWALLVFGALRRWLRPAGTERGPDGPRG